MSSKVPHHFSLFFLYSIVPILKTFIFCMHVLPECGGWKRAEQKRWKIGEKINQRSQTWLGGVNKNRLGRRLWKSLFKKSLGAVQQQQAQNHSADKGLQSAAWGEDPCTNSIQTMFDFLLINESLDGFTTDFKRKGISSF